MHKNTDVVSLNSVDDLIVILERKADFKKRAFNLQLPMVLLSIMGEAAVECSSCSRAER